MGTATWEFDLADHELKAQQADKLWRLTQDRHRRALERMQRAERMARDATTDEERLTLAHGAEIHHETALYHQRAAELFATHRDHERSFVRRMSNRSAAAAA